jgi:dTDP-4-dehydrorhamnose 3,5-epimerase
MVDIRTKTNPKISTRNVGGRENGFLVPIMNVHETFIDSEQWPQQVYLTVACPGEVKGPHLHKKRWGLFTCVKGNIKIVLRNDGAYQEYFSGEDYGYSTVQVPAGIPAALVNIGGSDAYILNMPSPAWQPDDQDEWEVAFEGYDFSAKNVAACAPSK